MRHHSEFLRNNSIFDASFKLAHFSVDFVALILNLFVMIYVLR